MNIGNTGIKSIVAVVLYTAVAVVPAQARDGNGGAYKLLQVPQSTRMDQSGQRYNKIPGLVALSAKKVNHCVMQDIVRMCTANSANGIFGDLFIDEIASSLGRKEVLLVDR